MYDIFAKLPGVYQVGAPEIETAGTATRVQKSRVNLVVSSILKRLHPLGTLAVKSPLSESAEDRLETENSARILAKLQGIKGVPRYYGAGLDREHYAQWIEGDTLLYPQGKLPFRDIQTFLIFAGRIISDGLGRGVIIRDVIPRNVVNSGNKLLPLDPENLSLVDFGKSYIKPKIRKNDELRQYDEVFRQNDLAPSVFTGVLTEMVIAKSDLEDYIKLLYDMFPPDKFLLFHEEARRRHYNSLGIFLATLETEEISLFGLKPEQERIIGRCLLRKMYQERKINPLLNAMRNCCGLTMIQNPENPGQYLIDYDSSKIMSLAGFLEFTKKLDQSDLLSV